MCHVSELAKTGDYVTFEFFGARGVVVRGEDGTLRAFHNSCRHRAHAVVSGERGNCPKAMTCAYHGWSYHLDGRNRSVSAADTFPKFDRSKFGLKTIDLEVFVGFVYVRFRSEGPSVAERMQPHVAELEHYKIPGMVPLDDLWVHDVDIDWKNLVENYVEDYHFPMGHPGLSALMEKEYDREVFAGGTMRLSHHMRAEPRDNWSARGYARFLPVIEHLPEHMRRRWTYIGLFPNVFFDIYPEWMDFFQLIPLGPGRTRIRARSYGYPDDRREMKAARWFCARLNVRVQTRRRGTHRIRAARARLRRLHARNSFGQGSRARRIPGLDPRAHTGQSADRGAAGRSRRGAQPGARVMRAPLPQMTRRYHS